MTFPQVRTVNSVPGIEPETEPSESSRTPIVIVHETSSAASDTNQLICFVCNTSTNKPFADLYGTVSAYSTTPIFDFVWKFLGGKPSVRNDAIDAPGLKNDVICAVCLDMFNKYDESHLNSRRFKKEIKCKLESTEAYFEKRQHQDAIMMTEPSDDQNPSNEGAVAHTYVAVVDTATGVIDLCGDD